MFVRSVVIAVLTCVFFSPVLHARCRKPERVNCGAYGPHQHRSERACREDNREDQQKYRRCKLREEARGLRRDLDRHSRRDVGVYCRKIDQLGSETYKACFARLFRVRR